MERNTLENALPSALEAEQYLLGSIFNDNERLSMISHTVLPEHFYSEHHQYIYQSMLDASKKGKPLMPFDFANDNVPFKYMWDISDKAIGNIIDANVTDCAELIIDKFKKRKLVEAGRDLSERAGEGNFDVNKLLAEHGKDLAELNQEAASHKDTDQVIQEALQQVEDAVKNGGEILGMKSQMSNLDDSLNGFHKKRFYIVAGRPAMGKSAFTTSIISNMLAQDVKVGIFSLEMSDLEILKRLWSIRTEIPYTSIERGSLKPKEFYKLNEVKKKINKTNLFIDDTPGVNITHIKNIATKWVGMGVDIIFVDHIGLSKSLKDYGSRTYEIEEMTTGLKNLSKDLNVSVCGVCQLNRGVEARNNKRPLLSDLRDSGSVEQDADAVILLYRASYYLQQDDNKDEKLEEKIIEYADKAEIDIAKNRHGPTTRFEVNFDAETMHFFERT